ncbi:MAG: outer membrane protein assembly factor BamA, partial [Acidobacteria bacterium]|nr:outer membrane protein assembly factor BamA [Acidobacteriota bacterium]
MGYRFCRERQRYRILLVHSWFEGVSIICVSTQIEPCSAAAPVGRTFRIIPVLLLLISAALWWSIPAVAQQQIVQNIVIHGNRRIPTETVKARIFTKPGDIYDEAALERDFSSLWNAGYFEDLRFEREDTPKGPVVHVYVKEKPTIRELNYLGLNSVSQSDVLDRFKERKVGLTVENQYDPTKVKKAEVTIKELLSEHGRQFATIRTEVRPIPPAAVAVTFVVKEGPKVKVGRIKFENNKNLSARYLRYSMKNLRPIGIPHSIILENLISKTYDASKLTEDTERVRDAYQQKGYFKAIVQDPRTQIRDTGGGFHIPFIQKGGGKAVDITIPVDEGARYRLQQITFKNNKAISNSAALRRLFTMKDGDIFNTALVRKGLDNLRDAYGQYGYINFTPVPNTTFDDEKKLISLEIDVNEGKQFYVRRIEFQGNTTTRDKVIRRELALEEGQVYSKKAWDFSILRLNQLGYFEALKPEQDTEVKQNVQESTVDLTLKVKEKGKNSIGLTGGVSGLAGSFIGINYQTNNFLGLGETLTVEFNIGNRERNVMFGFTEPYVFDRPLQVGFTVFNRRYNYNQAQQASILTGQQINLPQGVLNTLQNFTQNTTGFTVSASYPLRHSLKRVGLTYSFDTSSLTVFSQASQLYFETLAFSGLSGPNALQGVITSKVVPSVSWTTINSPQRPTSGRSFFFAGEVAGLGGTVRSLRPIVEYKQFIPMRGLKPTKDLEHRTGSLGVRFQGSFLTGYGGLVAPPFERFYLGGDTDLRGFDVRSVSPVAFLTQSTSVTLQNPDATFIPIDPANPRRGNVAVPIPVSQLVFPGGDTSLISNTEYRIPIVGPVTLAPFVDFGMNFVARGSQLRVTDAAFNALNTTGFGCGTLANFACVPTVPAGSIPFNRELTIVPGTNYVPRLSTGLELQVLMPIINAPFRVYWAYNPLLLDTTASTP